MSGTVTWKQTGPRTEEPLDYVPSNNVQGFGRVGGRKVVFTADDFSIRAGHADGALMEKTVCVLLRKVEGLDGRDVRRFGSLSAGFPTAFV